jgi:membrane-associated phospholipid phosphatase
MEGWKPQLGARLRSHWALKGVGIIVYITAFMFAYFALLRHPQFPITTMPLRPLDHLVVFTPWAIVPYASLWFYIALVPSLLYLRGEMVPYLGSVTVLSLIGCGIFLFWPTQVPAFGIDWTAHPSVAFLKSADVGGNAFPSLHVAFSVLTAIWLGWLFRRIRAPRVLHAANIAWCLLIVWSTLATKQHVALDAEAGTVLGGVIALSHLYFWPSLSSRRAVGSARVFHG